MTTYPTNIKVLDKDITNTVMEEGDITAQTLYTLYIEPGTLDTNSTLRIKATISRVVGTPLPDSDVTCIPCSEGGRAVTQQLTEAGILTPYQSLLTAQGSFSYVGEYNDQHEIYEAIYNLVNTPGGTFDQDTNLKLYRIRGNQFQQVAKVLTTTFNDLDVDDAQLVHGIADEPTYAFCSIVSISSNAPHNFYLYYINDKSQISCPGFGQFYVSFYAVCKRKIFLVEKNTSIVRRFGGTGTAEANDSGVISASYGAPIAMHALGDFLYILTSSNYIVKARQGNFGIVAAFNLSPITNVRGVFAVNETTVYFSYGTASILGISALNIGDGVVTEIDSAISLSRAIGFGAYSTLHFKAVTGKSGYFYTTSSQTFGTHGHNAIMKIGPVDCP